MNASIHWLGDGSEVAIVPGPTAWDLIGKPPKLSWCGTSQSHPVVVFVHVPAPPAALTAKCVHLSGSAAVGGAVALGSTRAEPKTLLLAGGADGGNTVVEKVSQSGAVRTVLTIPDSLPMSFDPSGTHLLYIAGHKPPKLTEATISNGRLTRGPWLRRFGLEAAAW